MKEILIAEKMAINISDWPILIIVLIIGIIVGIIIGKK
jgi:riboflavin transporter FmnP